MDFSQLNILLPLFCLGRIYKQISRCRPFKIWILNYFGDFWSKYLCSFSFLKYTCIFSVIVYFLRFCFLRSCFPILFCFLLCCFPFGLFYSGYLYIFLSPIIFCVSLLFLTNFQMNTCEYLTFWSLTVNIQSIIYRRRNKVRIKTIPFIIALSIMLMELSV